jgi:hypothetical protein
MVHTTFVALKLSLSIVKLDFPTGFYRRLGDFYIHTVGQSTKKFGVPPGDGLNRPRMLNGLNFLDLTPKIHYVIKFYNLFANSPFGVTLLYEYEKSN